MSSKKHARVRAQNFGNIVLVFFLGFILLATVWVIRHDAVRDPYASDGRFGALTNLLKDAVAPELVVVTAPTVFAQEQAMSPRQLMARWDPIIAEASHRFHVPEQWIRAVIRMESGGRTMLGENEPIVSDAGALGIMQVMPGTYREMREQYGLGNDPFDPHDNIFAGAAYLRWLHGKYGYPALFAAYNDGPGNLEDHLARGRKFPAETRNYIAGIARMLGLSKSGAAAMAKFTRPDGTPVWIDSAKVSAVHAVQPGEFGADAQAVMNIGKKRQAVREDVATATALLRDHGGNV